MHTKWYYRDPNAPYPNRGCVLSVMALIEREELLLLERRSDAPVWSLIAGFVEDSESLTDALRREVYEESGLTVTNYTLFGFGTFTDPTRITSYPDGNIYRVASVVYRAFVESFDSLRASSESVELRFFEMQTLPTLDMPATQRPIVERLVSDDPPPHLD